MKPAGGKCMKWIAVNSQEEVDFINKIFGEFHDKNKNAYTWIAARAVQWRERDDLLGNRMAYMPD